MPCNRKKKKKTDNINFFFPTFQIQKLWILFLRFSWYNDSSEFSRIDFSYEKIKAVNLPKFRDYDIFRENLQVLKVTRFKTPIERTKFQLAR